MMDTKATAYSTVIIEISALYRWAASVVWETTKDASWLPLSIECVKICSAHTAMDMMKITSA